MIVINAKNIIYSILVMLYFYSQYVIYNVVILDIKYINMSLTKIIFYMLGIIIDGFLLFCIIGFIISITYRILNNEIVPFKSIKIDLCKLFKLNKK